MNEIKFTLPSNLDLDKIKNENFWRFTKDNLSINKLIFICSSIIESKCNNWRKMEENETDFAPLSSIRLKRVVNNYKDCIKFLLEFNVIECDRIFIEGKKCLGYRFNYIYSGSPLIEIVVNDYLIKRNIRRVNDHFKQIKEIELKPYNHLVKWWRKEDLQIDVEKTLKWIDEYKIQKQIKKHEKEKNRIADNCEIFKILVDYIDKGNYKFSIDKGGMRFYNPFTNLKRELRQFIKFKGQKLVSIDIKNSQPYLTIAICRSSFWRSLMVNRKERLSLQKIKEDYYKYIKEDNNLVPIITLLQSAKSIDQPDSAFSKFRDLVLSGEFYEYIQKEFQPEFKARFDTRQKVKKEVLRIFFFDPKKEFLKFYRPCQTFSKHFPEIYELFKTIKFNRYNRLPIILQRIESYLVIDIICRRITQLKPEIPIFTIHDSILTTEGNEGFVRDIMIEELNKWIGYPPELSIEYLRNENDDVQKDKCLKKLY